jgi:anhydro-N-acetylmuramic acid kinase
MIKQSYNIIGVMSGTSLDGVDLAYIDFNIQNGEYKYEIKEAATIPYNKEWIVRLKNAVDFIELQLQQLDKDYTVLLSQIIKSFIEDNSLQGIDAVCSHGHTILHQPAKRLTLQIGNLPEIAKLTQQRVVCNFRVQDVAMGGQGAPLVPIGDGLLFSDYFFCLNLGGFSNISFEKEGRHMAYDICAVNTVLNYYAGEMGFPYDDKGKIAASGSISNEMLNETERSGLLYKTLP